MNKMKWMSLNVLLVATVLAVGVGCEDVNTGTSKAQCNKPANVASADKTPMNANISDLQLASKLAEWGRANKAPEGLALAAKIVAGVASKDMPAEAAVKTSEGPAAAKSSKKDKPELTTGSLMTEAKALAGKNEKSLAAVAAIAAMPGKSRGPATGVPVLHKDKVKARQSDSYTVKLKGREKTQIGVIGDGDTDLDLYIYDENNNLVTKDVDSTDRCYVAVTPKWTGNFRIVIKNRGKVYNRYYLVIK